jgi:hypothetical protein
MAQQLEGHLPGGLNIKAGESRDSSVALGAGLRD